ncbi:MAG: T9SS type A sorting domain-containing protein [Ignavibacteriales bacterium]|nr:T9SS type A sorting domain-containing protein [Ignavibacteriales bacterium]
MKQATNLRRIGASRVGRWLGALALVLFVASPSFAQAPYVIYGDETWSSDITWTHSVIVDSGGTLTIDPGVHVRIEYADVTPPLDNIGDIAIYVRDGGTMIINGSPTNPVVFEPTGASPPAGYENAHWTGLVFEASSDTSVNDRLQFFEVKNAYNGIDFERELDLSGADFTDCYNSGLKIGVDGMDVYSLNFDGAGVIIDADDVGVHYSDFVGMETPGVTVNGNDAMLNWVTVDSSGTSGILVNDGASVNIYNASVTNSAQSGLVNLGGDVVAENLRLHNNAWHGALFADGTFDGTQVSITQNDEHGVVVAGDAATNVMFDHLTDTSNVGYGFLLTMDTVTADVQTPEADSGWGEPTVSVQSSNIYKNDLSGGEIQVWSNLPVTPTADFTSNWWGQTTDIDTLIEELSPGSVNYINWRTSDYGFVTGATANMNPPKDITITTPAADGYTLIEGEETTFTWDSDGNIQLITIETDYIGVLQANEEYYVIANTGEFDYTPQANFQGFTVKEYPDSSTLAQRTVASQLATTLNNPNASTGSVLGGDTLDIHWVAPPSVNKVKLEYSNDGGTTWNTIALSTENDGEYRWVVPNMAMNTTVQVQVTEISAAANASASPNFTVYPAPDRDGSWKFTETGSHNQMHVTFEDVDFFMEAPTYTALITTVESVFIGAFYEDGEGGVKCAGYTRLVSTTAGWGNDAQDNETDGGSGAETVSLTIYGDDPNTSELDGVPQTSPATNVIFKAWRYQWSVQDPDIDSPAGDGNDRTASPWNTTTNNVQAVGFTAGNIVVVDELQYIRGSNVSAPEQQLIPLSDAGNWLMISGYVTPSVLDFNYLGPASATTSDQILTDVRTSIATTQRQGFMTNTGQDNFVMIKDGDGSVYWWVSTSIGLVVTPTTFTKWDVDKGYMIKTSAAANVGDLALYGQPIDYSSRPIPLKAGWNLIPYTRKDSMNIGAALGSISGYYRIVKDQQGNIFWPAYSINDIGYMVANEAYLVYMDEATELLYPTSNSGPKMKNPVPYRAAPDATRYNVNYNSDNSSTIVFLESAFNETPQIGDEIGVFNKYGKLVGSATYAGGNVAITVWGVESGAEKGHGVKEGEEYVFKLFSKADGSEATLGGLTYMVGSGKYAAGAWSVISAVETVGEDVPTEFALSQNFPNPFNPATTIEFALPRAANVELKVYNLLGEVVATVAQGAFDAGYHQVTFNAANLASGIYFYSIEADDFTSVKKMTLLK